MTCLLSALLLCASSAAVATNANTAAFNRGGTTFGWNQQVPSAELRAFVRARQSAFAKLHGWLTQSVKLYRNGDSEGAASAAEALQNRPGLRPEDVFAVRVAAAYYRSTSPTAFTNVVATLVPEEASILDRFSLYRHASHALLALDATPSAVPRLKALQALSGELQWDEERVVYPLGYLADAPKSADVAFREDVFARLPRENRIGLYKLYDKFYRNKELKLLKSEPKPDLAAARPGKSAAVAAAYDADGVHVYLRLDDPDAWQMRDGVGEGAMVEYEFQPGGETPSHWQLMTSADTVTDQAAGWDSPRRGYRVAAEFIRQDAVSTDRSHGFHIFIPWLCCWTEFPSDGDVWRLSLVAKWADCFGALGGGAVHELGRAMHLKFSIDGRVRAEMRRRMLRQAVGRYRAVRAKWEEAEFWDDPHLGDRMFYAAEVKPFVEALDAIAAEAMRPDLTDADVERLCRERLFDLAEFRLTLDARRAAFVKKRLFNDRTDNKEIRQ